MRHALALVMVASLQLLVACGPADRGSAIAEPGDEAVTAQAGLLTFEQAADEFILDAVDWMTTVEDSRQTVALGGYRFTDSTSAQIRNGMRNSISWVTSPARGAHEREGLSTLGMCMTAYAMKEAYWRVDSTRRGYIESNLKFLQRALIGMQNRTSGNIAQYAFPATRDSTQYSVKTNAICGLTFIELYWFWKARAEAVPTDTLLPLYRDDAQQAAKEVRVFLKRMQQPTTLPTLTSLPLSISAPDANGDGIYDGIFEEVRGGKLVLATATWGAMAGRYFKKLAEQNWLTAAETTDLLNRANGMKTFFAHALNIGAEHFSPRYTCPTSACQYKFMEIGDSIAKVAGCNNVNGNTPGNCPNGGDGQWHGRLAPSVDSTPGPLYDNLNGTDPVQWALNALYGMDPAFNGSHFSHYFSDAAGGAKQVHSTNDTYYLMNDSLKRDIFLGLGTYIAHGRVSPTATNVFQLYTSGNEIAHYVRKDTEYQVVTSNYGDNAVSAWAPAGRWASANTTLLKEYPSNPTTAVVFGTEYDFGTLSHLAHWAMKYEKDAATGVVTLSPKVSSTTSRVTVSSENLASTLCRVLRARWGTSECTM
jgi:hypothetical protein